MYLGETPKKHKKHKKDREYRDREEGGERHLIYGVDKTPSGVSGPGLKLILKKPGGSPGPEPSTSTSISGGHQQQLVPPMSLNLMEVLKKAKKEKKARKKEKKKEKKHKHHHKEKKKDKAEKLLESDGKPRIEFPPLIKKLILPIPQNTIPIPSPAPTTTSESSQLPPTAPEVVPTPSETPILPPPPSTAPATVTAPEEQPCAEIEPPSTALEAAVAVVASPLPLAVPGPTPMEEGVEEAQIPIPSETGGVKVGNEEEPPISELVPPTRKEIPRATVKKNEKALQKLLDYLLKSLEKKDPQQFFAWPVTDKIAPGYSSLITQPMDFSTMKQKVDDCSYLSLMEFEDDFKLMCKNALTYNHQDTIYYKAAKKLGQSGLRMLYPDKVRALLPMIPAIRVLAEDQLGFPIIPEGQEGLGHADFQEEDFYVEKDPQKSIHYMRPHPNDPPDLCGSFVDELTTEEVLIQARLAARDAAHRLSMRKPKTHMGFLRVREDGSTSMSILTPSSGVYPGTKERPLQLGVLSGKLSVGSIQLLGNKDEKKTLRGVKPLYYGAFSSFAPCNDSTFANLTAEETELVNSAYGDETAVQYAESLIEFAKNSDYAIRMVDEVLNTLTKGEHSKAVNIIGERKKMEEEEKIKKDILERSWTQDSTLLTKFQRTFKVLTDLLSKNELFAKGTVEGSSTPTTIDYDSLRSLGDLGIDTSFLDVIDERKLLQERLNETGKLIRELELVQTKRLSQPPLTVPPYVHQPDEEEVNLADKVVQNLMDLIRHAHPGEVAPTSTLRKAMGVKLAHQGPLMLPDLQKLMEPPAGEPTTNTNDGKENGENDVTVSMDETDLDKNRVEDSRGIKSENISTPLEEQSLQEPMEV